MDRKNVNIDEKFVEKEVRMKICLIIPPSDFLSDERVFMTLGILKVASVLEKAEHHVDVIDMSGI